MDNLANGGLKKLEDMNLSGVVLSGVDANSLSQAIIKIKSVSVAETRLTAQQCQQLMETIATLCPKRRKLEVRVESLQTPLKYSFFNPD